MDTLSISASTLKTSYREQQTTQSQRLLPKDLTMAAPKDILTLGQGDPVSNDQAMQVVLNRAMEKLKSVVTDAKQALGISEDTKIDTTPTATANRIADFALGAFGNWQKQHPGLEETDAKKQFADFIGGAIKQGISEASTILGSLNALNTDVQNNISATWDQIQTRLNDFVGNQK